MPICCPKCGAPHKVTEFEACAFVKCTCGFLLDLSLIETVEDFLRYFVNGKRTGSWRLATKSLNDMMANLAIQIAGEFGKPIQFHTGFGDNDLRLVKANPAFMQNVIEAYPKAKIVLLHSSYPFTREAGYLATVYDNVYLDCVTPV